MGSWGAAGRAIFGLGSVLACQPLQTLQVPADAEPPDGVRSALLAILPADGAPEVWAYEAPLEFAPLTLPEEARAYLFYYADSLGGLGLEPGRVPSDPGPAGGTPIPLGLMELGLDTRANPWRWTPLRVRPAELDRARLPGTPPSACLEGGGCYLDREAVRLGRCAFDCADRISAEAPEPVPPTFSEAPACPEGWSRTLELQAPWPPSDLPAQATVSFAPCAPPERGACASGTLQVAGAEGCEPLADCSEAAWVEAVRQAASDGGDVFWVGSRPPEGPPGPEVADLAQAIDASVRGDVIALSPGSHALSSGAPGRHFVGSCPGGEQGRVATLESSVGIPSGQVERLRLRLTGPSSPVGPASASLRATQLEAAVSVDLDVPQGTSFRAERVRIVQEAGALGWRVGGSAEWDGLHGDFADLRVRDGGSMVVRDSVLRAEFSVEGELRVSDSILEGQGGSSRGLLRLEDSVLRTSEDGLVQVSDGRAELLGVTLRGAGVVQTAGQTDLDRVYIADPPSWGLDWRGGISTARRLWIEGGGIRAAESARGTIFDGVLRDPGFGQACVFARNESSVQIERLRCLGADTAVKVIEQAQLGLRDGAIEVGASSCEAFIFGPPPRRTARVRDRRGGLECLREPGWTDDPADATYARARWEVDLHGVWVRDGSQPAQQRNSMRAVGAGTLELDGLRYAPIPGRALLVQGPVDLAIGPARFERGQTFQGCSFSGLRFEPARPTSRVEAEFPRGSIENVWVRDVTVGVYVMVGPAVRPSVRVRDLLVEGGRVGLTHVLASDVERFVEPEPEDWQVRTVYRGQDDAVFAASLNQTCD